jgi:hypothetical protein
VTVTSSGPHGISPAVDGDGLVEGASDADATGADALGVGVGAGVKDGVGATGPHAATSTARSVMMIGGVLRMVSTRISNRSRVLFGSAKA